MDANKKFREAFTELFKTFSPVQLNALTDSLRAAAHEQAMSGGGIPATTSSFRVSKSTSRANRRKDLLDRIKPKRPLNAFIAYRTYYSPLFKGIPQKLKSGLLRQMWGAENKHALWALLGCAYSDLRDHHEETLSVEKFLSITVPLVPIIPAEKYLSKMGWILSSNFQELHRDAAFNADVLAAEYPTGTNWSVADIVDHCYNLGLMDRDTRRDPEEYRRQALLNAGFISSTSAGNQTPPPSCGTLTLAVTPQSSTTMETDASSMDTPTEGTSDETVDAGVGGLHEEEEPEIELHDAIMNSNTYLSVAAVTADQQTAFDNIDTLALHFHPGVQPPILGFDPRVIQDDFDPFDLDFSELINYDM
ncbi:hypothetical protein LTR67_004944 [Exophiala xenobiotica]